MDKNKLTTAGMDTKFWYNILIGCFQKKPLVRVKNLTAEEILIKTNWSAEYWFESYGLPKVRDSVEIKPSLACNICGKLFMYRDAFELHLELCEEDI